MFFTKLIKPKQYRELFKKEIKYTRKFHVFSDTITDIFYMKCVLIQKNNGKYSYFWEYSNYPLTPSGIFYNLHNRFFIFREVFKLNWKTRIYRKQNIVN